MNQLKSKLVQFDKSLKMIAIKILAVALLVQVAQAAIDFCDPKLCTDYKGDVKPHIGCNNPGWGPDCTSSKTMVKFTDAMKQQMLKEQNEKRNGIASGSVAGFGPATRMATFVWSDELAYLAELNVKQCSMTHDQCHNTPEFMTSGQNLHSAGSKPDFAPIESIISGSVNGWYKEIKDASQANIDKFGTPAKGVIGHFTEMMTAHSTHIGCAISQMTDAKGWKKTYVACNYAAPNMNGASIFVKGPAASECKNKNPDFPALCAVGEDIDPNKFDNQTYD